MPLEITDPKDELGDGGGARIDFDTEELVWVNRMGLAEFEAETFAKRGSDIEDFSFQPFEMFKSYVKEVARAAGRVEDSDLAKVIVEGVDFGACFFEVARTGMGDGGPANALPFGAERFDHGREDETLDI
jgi:hypothetical protein